MKEDVLSMIFGVNTIYDVKEYLKDFKNICDNFVAFKSQLQIKTKFANSFTAYNKDMKHFFPTYYGPPHPFFQLIHSTFSRTKTTTHYQKGGEKTFLEHTRAFI